MMDVYNSTEITAKKTSMEMAQIYHQLIKKASSLICYEYYPFIQFVEACGDSLMFIHSPELMLPLDDIFIEVLCFSLKLTEKLNKYLKAFDVYIRCGISYGNVTGGIIDGKTMRWFGKPIHKAARLESICQKDHVVLDDVVYEKICENNRNIFDTNSIKKEIISLKGLGDSLVYQVNKDDIMDSYISFMRPSASITSRSSNEFFL